MTPIDARFASIGRLIRVSRRTQRRDAARVQQAATPGGADLMGRVLTANSEAVIAIMRANVVNEIAHDDAATGILAVLETAPSPLDRQPVLVAEHDLTEDEAWVVAEIDAADLRSAIETPHRAFVTEQMVRAAASTGATVETAATYADSPVEVPDTVPWDWTA